MKTQLMVLADAIAFLEKTLDAAFAKVSNPNEREIRRSFIHRHACNVHDIAMDVFFLGQRGSFGSVYILMRPALESFINIGAAIALKDYAAQKVLNEIHEEKDKYTRWRNEAEAELVAELEAVIKECEEFATDFHQRNNVTPTEWKIWKAAKEAKLKPEYIRDYFLGSKHVHAMLSALTGRGEVLYASEGVFRLTNIVSHTAAMVNQHFCVSMEIFEVALELRNRAKAARSN